MGLFTGVEMKLRTAGLKPAYDTRHWFKHSRDPVPPAYHTVLSILSDEKEWQLEKYRVNGYGENYFVFLAKNPPVVIGIVQADLLDESGNYDTSQGIFHIWRGETLHLPEIFKYGLGGDIHHPNSLAWLNRSASFNFGRWRIFVEPFKYKGHPIYRGNIVAEDPRRIVITAKPLDLNFNL